MLFLWNLLEFNIFTTGTGGAMVLTAGILMKGVGANGYIRRSFPICNYALRCCYSCCLLKTQKVTPLSGKLRRYFL